MNKNLAKQPIKVPENPFWGVFKRFGLDEMMAMIVNVAATFIVSLLTTSMYWLVFAGPVFEKFGFFIIHIKEAIGVYRTTSKELRENFSFYLRQAIKRGSKSLIEDVLVHDPLYALFMTIGLVVYSQTPAWFLSGSSFFIAVIIVAVLEVSITELRYWWFKRKLISHGFGYESYYETRFHIKIADTPKVMLENISKVFDLNNVDKLLNYSDNYFKNTLPDYSGRLAKTRLRRRSRTVSNDWIQTLQVVFTRARQHDKHKIDQFRYFLIKKEKLYFNIDTNWWPPFLTDIEKLSPQYNFRKLIRADAKHYFRYQDVNFSRYIARNEELLVSIDKLKDDDKFYIVEVKVFTDLTLLKKAMRFIMQEFSCILTTAGKQQIVHE